MHEIEIKDFENLDSRYRATLINSITGFKSLNLVGTQDEKGQENLAIFSQVVHLGASPPLIGMIIRPDVSPRHTLENIIAHKFYTLNHVNSHIFKQAHQTAARYDREISEFEVTGLTSQHIAGFDAPFVGEANIQIGLEFAEKMDIQINNTSLIIGHIRLLRLRENYIKKDGFVDLEQAGTITCAGLDSYHSTKKIARLSYAKPYKPLDYIE
ncbi:MAG: flavin reductase [Bernardetiaceae bacterium]|nr:flavin reductase [Bernardetiaceae bacterium]